MSSYNVRTLKNSPSANQRFRLLTVREKPVRCDWVGCSKPATGLAEKKAYCPHHFFATVSQHWQ